MSHTKNKYAAIFAMTFSVLFYFLVYVIRVEPGILANDLMAEFKMTSSTLGFMAAVLYMPYVAMQVPFGVIVDKLGVKLTTILCGSLCVIGTFIFGSASNVEQLEIGRFLIGLGSASAFICCGKTASEFFDTEKLSALLGIAMFMGCLGGICGTGPVAFLVEKIGWRNTTYILSAAVVILLIATTFFMTKPKPSPENKTTELKLLSGLKAIAKNPKAWIAGFYGAISYLPLSAMAELWGIPFMEQRYGISTEKASISSMLIFIGFGLGGIFTAKIAEKINSYKKTIIISSALMLITFTIAIYSNSIGYYLYLSLILILGFCAGANTLTFTLASALVPKEFMGTSTGFMNMLVMSSGILFQSLLGKLLDFFRNGLVTDSGEPIYNITMYRSAFLVIALSMILAVIAALFINDIKRKEEK